MQSTLDELLSIYRTMSEAEQQELTELARQLLQQQQQAETQESEPPRS